MFVTPFVSFSCRQSLYMPLTPLAHAICMFHSFLCLYSLTDYPTKDITFITCIVLRHSSFPRTHTQKSWAIKNKMNCNVSINIGGEQVTRVELKGDIALMNTESSIPFHNWILVFPF